MYELEILSIQSKSRASQSQAKLVLDREKPNVRTMSFANATRQIHYLLYLPLPPPPPSIPINPSIPSNCKVPKATSSKFTLPTFFLTVSVTTDIVRKIPPNNHYTTASPPYSDASSFIDGEVLNMKTF